MANSYQASDLRADPALTIGAQKLLQGGDSFKADELCTVINTNTTSGKFLRYLSNYTLLPAAPGDASTSSQIEDLEMAPNGAYPTADFDAAQATFATKDHGLQAIVRDRDRDEAQMGFGASLIMDTAASLMEKVKSSLDLRVATLAHTTGNWTNTAAAAAAWDNASEDSIGDINTAAQTIQKLGGPQRKLLTVAFGQDQLDVLRDAAKIKEAVKYDSLEAASFGDQDLLLRRLAQYWGVGRVVVFGSVRNSAAEGQTASGAFNWSTDNAWIGWANPNPNTTNSAIGRFSLTSENMKAFQGRNPLDEHTTIRVKNTDQVAVLNADWGYTITGTIT